MHHSPCPCCGLQERRLQLLDLWQPALSPQSVAALDLRHYMTSSLVSAWQTPASRYFI